MVGYLLVGALIGEGGLGLVAEENRSLEYLARAGALLLLFAIGIEFSLDELVRLRRHFFIGGSVQMVLVAVPVLLAGVLLGLSWQAAVLVGSAAALSSTVLVYRALEEWGHATSPHGRRAVGILLFQDIALVPLILLVPLLTDVERQPVIMDYLFLALASVLFVAAVLASRIGHPPLGRAAAGEPPEHGTVGPVCVDGTGQRRPWRVCRRPSAGLREPLLRVWR